MKELSEILGTFDPISLKEMDRVKLMDRTDIKFMFNLAELPAFISEIAGDYRVLETEGKRTAHYRSLYYDTSGLHLYTLHQNGKLNRYKIRHRTYVDSKTGFLEVKFKSNKGRTIKNRIKEPLVPHTWNQNALDFLREKLPFDPHALQPVLWVNYNRMTLVNKHDPERLTIDFNLEFIFGDKNVTLGDLVVAEVKQENKRTSPFADVMKKYHVRRGGISKYCLGMALTNENVKKNNFKAKLIYLKHILNDRCLTSVE